MSQPKLSRQAAKLRVQGERFPAGEKLSWRRGKIRLAPYSGASAGKVTGPLLAARSAFQTFLALAHALGQGRVGRGWTDGVGTRPGSA
jgi:hypothetical protein